jgi:hypothetical protein
MSATCTHQAIGHRADATALNTLGGSKKDKGWSMARTRRGGVANVVYCSSNDLCKNNYYHALSTPSSCNPTHLPSSHTGIANFSTSGFYFAPSAPIANLNPKVPSIGVQVANSLPKRSVANATLASVPSLPPAAMQGHVMPSFPYTLIGLGPFADLSCSIVFTKTAVNVIDPDGQSILEGWWEQDGPRLWRFPIKANKPSLPVMASLKNNEEPGPRVSAANFSLPPPATPIQHPASPLPSPQPPTVVPPPTPSPHPPVVPPVHHLHPSQGVQATSTNEEACSVLYLYGAAQAMAMAARASSTLFDPRSMDLPSIGALVGFYHACLRFPVKQTWLEAVKAGNCDSFDGLTYSNVSQYCPDANKTILGHMAQQRQNVRSSKPKSDPSLALVPLSQPPATVDSPSNQVFIKVHPLSRLYTDDTGSFLVKARSGNQYVMIGYHADGNLILQQAFKARNDCHRIAAYNSIMTRLTARVLAVDLQILDNEASAAYKEAITFKWNAKFQLVPPDMHRRNQAERAIHTFKNHFLLILVGVDAAFPPYLWDLLLTQAELTLNLLRQATFNPRISAWEFFQGPFDFNKTPLGPVGCRVLIHAKPSTR